MDELKDGIKYFGDMILISVIIICLTGNCISNKYLDYKKSENKQEITVEKSKSN